MAEDMSRCDDFPLCHLPAGHDVRCRTSMTALDPVDQDNVRRLDLERRRQP